MTTTTPETKPETKPEATPEAKPAARSFETVTCGRCGGTGNYSYCQMHGTRCFKCWGTGLVYTKRGAAARKFYEDLCHKPVEEVKVGDTIRVSLLQGACFVKVLAITAGDPNDGFRYFDKVANDWKPMHLATDFEVKTERLNMVLKPGSPVRMAQSAAEKAAKKVLALEYEDTLTKAGTVNKRKAKKTERAEPATAA
jgi:hypothetical protein